MKYTIYQLPIENNLAFRSWEEFEKSHSLKSPRDFHRTEHLKEWRKVYDGEIEQRPANSKAILEHIFTILNTMHPKDYRARSLSVSDLVELENGELWFCDNTSWVLLSI